MSLDDALREIGVKTSEARRLEEEGKFEEAVELLTQLSQELRVLADRADTTSLRGVLMQRSIEYANNATRLKRRHMPSAAAAATVADQQGVAAVQLLRGADVATQLFQLLQSAQYRVLIATHQLHAVTIPHPSDEKGSLNLITVLQELYDAGVKVRILTTPPALLPGVTRWKQADALRTLAAHGIEFRLCSHLHFNGVLVDDGAVWRGTAPLTEAGLTGLNDVVEYSTANWLQAVYLELFRNRWEQSDSTCVQCYEKTCLSKFKSEDPRHSYEGKDAR